MNWLAGRAAQQCGRALASQAGTEAAEVRPQRLDELVLQELADLQGAGGG